MNKTKKTELDVDFIGGQGSLSIEEENVLRDFFKQNKMALKKSLIRTIKHKKVIA